MIGRSMPDSEMDADGEEMKGIFAAVDNNIPRLLQEMHLTREQQSAAGWQEKDGGLLTANGPLVSSHMQTFAFKVGFSLYYELTKKVLPKTWERCRAVVFELRPSQWHISQSVFEHLLPPNTLRQGKFEVLDQFAYQWRLRRKSAWRCFSPPFVIPSRCSRSRQWIKACSMSKPSIRS
jgi:hypothetical protein